MGGKKNRIAIDIFLYCFQGFCFADSKKKVIVGKREKGDSLCTDQFLRPLKVLLEALSVMQWRQKGREEFLYFYHELENLYLKL